MESQDLIQRARLLREVAERLPDADKTRRHYLQAATTDALIDIAESLRKFALVATEDIDQRPKTGDDDG